MVPHSAKPEDILDEDLKHLLDLGIIESSVDEKGEFIFWLTEYGRQVGEELDKLKGE